MSDDVDALLAGAATLDEEGQAALLRLFKQKTPPLSLLAPLERWLFEAPFTFKSRAALLNAFLELIPHLEVAWSAEERQPFTAIGERLAAALPNEDPRTLPQLIDVLGLLRAAPAVVLPFLLSRLSTPTTSDGERAVDSAARALAWYGAAAAQAGAIEPLRALAQLGHRGHWARAALVALGEPAVGAKPAKPKKPFTFPPSTPPELAALLVRMGAPSEPWANSSFYTTSAKAHRQAERLADPGLIPAIREIFAAKPDKELAEDLYFILEKLTLNTGSAAGVELLRDRWRLPNLTPKEREEVMNTLAGCGHPDAAPLLLEALELILAGQKWSLFQVTDYFVRFPSDEAFELLARIAFQDLSHNALFVVMMFEGSAFPAARLPLERFVAHPDLGYKKQRDLELRLYAIGGLGRIADPASVPVLIAEYEKKQRATMAATVHALEKIDHPQAREVVTRALGKKR